MHTPRSQPVRAAVKTMALRLNTSNEDKMTEFSRMFAKLGSPAIDRTSIDLDEIDGTPHEVVQNKATAAGNGIIIEDTSLDVEGADVGVNIRWIVENMEQFSGKKATWRVLLGVLDGSIDKVNIYEGIVEGIIVPSRGDSGFGFDPVFLPNGSDKTLAQEKGDEVSARYRAIQALVQNTPVAVADPIASADWKGKWQH